MREWLIRALGGLPRTSQDPESGLEGLWRAVRELRRDVAATQDAFALWEATAAKKTRELSRILKSLAEVERRERAKSDELELEEEPDLVQRTLDVMRRNGS